MSASLIYVKQDGRLIGYSRWQNTMDVMETAGIYATSSEAGDRKVSIEKIARQPTDVLVTLHFGEDTPGWHAWANASLTVLTDDGFRHVDGAHDYKYVDVLDTP